MMHYRMGCSASFRCIVTDIEEGKLVDVDLGDHRGG